MLQRRFWVLKKPHSGLIRNTNGGQRWGPGLIIGVLWAAVVFIVHVKSMAQGVPLSFGRSLELLASKMTLGPHFLDFWGGHLLRLAGCGLFMAGLLRVGKFLGRSVGLISNPLPDSVDSILSFGLGLSFAAYLAFAFLLIKGGGEILLRGSFVILCVVGILEFQHAHGRSLPTIAARMDPTEKLLLAVLICGVLTAFIGTTIPEISYDALVYHLAVPQSYLLAGQMVDLPYNHYSYLPLLTSMIFAWGLSAGGVYMAKLINFTIGMATLRAVYVFADAQGGRKLALSACVLVISIPLVLYLHWMTNSDLGASLFLILAVICCWKWCQDKERGSYLKLMALFCGMAMATKYTTGVGVLALMAYGMATLWSAPTTDKNRTMATMVLLVSLPLVPWWTRNMVFQGNPFYPYATGYFGGGNFDPELLRNWYAETRDGTPGLAFFPHIAKIWRDAIIGYQDVPYDYMGPLMLGLAPISLFVMGRSWLAGVVVTASAAYFVGLSATYISRLLIPYILVAGTGVVYCLASGSPARSWLLAFFILMTSHNIYRFAQISFLTSVNGFGVALGQQSPSEYLMTARNWYPNPSYGAFQHVGGLGLGKNERVLMIGDSRVFYSPHQTIASAPHDIPVIFSWAKSAEDPDALFQKLVSENISVVVSNKAESPRTDSPKYVNEREIRMISYLLAHHFKMIYEDNWTAVFRR